MENQEEIIFKEPRKTFMEILKVNNREVPFANILAYFFRPKEDHGLKTLFLDALLKTKFTNIGTNPNDEETPEILDYDINSVKVFVEKKTENKNRIDLLIETNTFVICIEFKINHHLNNPLIDYKEFIEKYYPNKQKFYFILTPFKKDPIDKAKDYFLNSNEFEQIILSHFIKRVQQKIVENHSKSDINKESEYFLDFIQTIENREIRSKRHIYLEKLQIKLNEQKIKSKYHSNSRGGFLEIGKLKVRFNVNGIQIENWNDKVGEKIYGPNKKLEHNKLIEIIKTSI